MLQALDPWIALIDQIVRIFYPIASLIAWVIVYRHGKETNKKLRGMDTRMNGRVDELIASRETIAFDKGRREALGEIAIAAKEKKRDEIALARAKKREV